MKKPQRKGAGRVAFLARKDLFRSLLEAGHPQRWIYDDHVENLGISYSQFNRYVGRYLAEKVTNAHQDKARAGHGIASYGGNSTVENGSGMDAEKTPKEKSGNGASTGFRQNGNSGADRDDLI